MSETPSINPSALEAATKAIHDCPAWQIESRAEENVDTYYARVEPELARAAIEAYLATQTQPQEKPHWIRCVHRIFNREDEALYWDGRTFWEGGIDGIITVRADDWAGGGYISYGDQPRAYVCAAEAPGYVVRRPKDYIYIKAADFEGTWRILDSPRRETPEVATQTQQEHRCEAVSWDEARGVEILVCKCEATFVRMTDDHGEEAIDAYAAHYCKEAHRGK